MPEKLRNLTHYHQHEYDKAEVHYTDHKESVAGTEHRRQKVLGWVQLNYEAPTSYYGKGSPKELLQEVAIIDATAAGHDVDFGGMHFAAQQSEQPKEPQQQ